jgi:hypothetical protein
MRISIEIFLNILIQLRMDTYNLSVIQSFSLIVLGETQRKRFNDEPALSFVPEARPPPNGCCPTTAPVGLSLI